MWNSWFWFLDFQRNHFRDGLSYLPTCMWVGIFQSLAVWILNVFRYLQKLYIDIEIHWELKEPCLLVIFVQLHMRFIPGLVQRTFWLDWDNPRQLVNIVTDRRQACILKTLVRLWPVQHLTLYLTRSSLNHSLLLISMTPDSLIFLLFVLFFLATFLGHPSFHNLLVYLGAVIHSQDADHHLYPDKSHSCISSPDCVLTYTPKHPTAYSTSTHGWPMGISNSCPKWISSPSL